MTTTMTRLDYPQVLKKSYDEVNEALKTVGVGGTLVPDKYDYIELTYVSAGAGSGQVETVVYKLSGSTVATLTLTYNAQNKLATVTRT